MEGDECVLGIYIIGRKNSKGILSGLRICEISESNVMANGIIKKHDANTREITPFQAKTFIGMGKTIVGLGVNAKGELYGTNGSIERYADITQNTDKSPIVILNKIGSDGFGVVDCNGHVRNLKNDVVIKYASSHGIANGKLVSSEEGKKFISSISGEYNIVGDSSDEPTNVRNNTTNTHKEDNKQLQSTAGTNRVNIQNVAKQRESTACTVAESVSTDGTDTTSVETHINTADISEQHIETKNITSNGNSDRNTSQQLQTNGDTELDVKNVKEISVEHTENGESNGFRRVLSNGGLKWYEGNELRDERLNLTVGEKMAIANMTLQQWNPFVHSILKQCEIIPCNGKISGINTMGVAYNKMVLYYCCEWVQKLPLGMVVGVIIHETYHIIHRHAARANGRDHSLWNMAGDFYINRLIAKQFRIDNNPFEESVVDMDCEFISDKALINKGLLQTRLIGLPQGGAYSKNINVDKDSAESIYEEILKDINRRKQNKNGSNSGQQGNQQGSQQGGQQGQQGGQQGSQNGQQDSQQGNQQGQQGNQQGQQGNQQGQQGNQQGQQGNQQGNQQGSQQGNQQGSQQGNQQGSQQGQQGNQNRQQGSQNGQQDSQQGNQQGQQGGQQGQQGGQQGQQGQQVQQGSQQGQQGGQQGGQQDSSDSSESTGENGKTKFTLRGEDYECDFNDSDIVNDGTDKDGNNTRFGNDEDTNARDYDEMVKNAVANAVASVRMAGRELSAGEMRLVNSILMPKVDYRALLRNKLNLAGKPKSTFKRPGRRGELAPDIESKGKLNMDKDGLKNAVVAIDSSGSITDDELTLALGYIRALAKQMKVDVEVIFWGTSVTSSYSLKKEIDLVKIKPTDGGGTDVTCVFEYITGKCEVMGRKYRKHCSLLIVVTDGYFSENYGMYRKAADDVIWLITEKEYPVFKQLFGQKAPCKY